MNAKKVVPAILALALAFGLAGCSATTGVTTDVDPTVDFSKYRSFSMVRDASRKEVPAVQLFENAIAAALEARGVKRVESGADMTLAPKFFVSSRTVLNPYSGSQTVMQDVQVGTITVDLLDAKTNALLWRGSVKGEVDPTLTPEERQKRAKAVGAELFGGFPPAPRK
jgi:hypothetical protein